MAVEDVVESGGPWLVALNHGMGSCTGTLQLSEGHHHLDVGDPHVVAQRGTISARSSSPTGFPARVSDSWR